MVAGAPRMVIIISSAATRNLIGVLGLLVVLLTMDYASLLNIRACCCALLVHLIAALDLWLAKPAALQQGSQLVTKATKTLLSNNLTM